MGWKYIIFENKLPEGTTVLFPVIFPDKLVHSEVYQHLKPLMPGWRAQGVAPYSAGKIEHLVADGLGGDSETLGITSQGGDTQIIESYSYLHGVI